MNPCKSVPAAALGLLAALAVVAAIFFLTGDGGPGTSTIKSLVERQMAEQFPGSAIRSISVVRGGRFLSQGHAGQVSYGTPVYSMYFKVTFSAPLPNGNLAYSRTLFLYQNSEHHWVRDPDAH